jgi:hypothetical protein
MKITTDLLGQYPCAVVKMELPYFGSTTYMEILQKLAGRVEVVYDSSNDKALQKKEGRQFYNRTTRTFSFLWDWYSSKQNAHVKFETDMKNVFQPTFLKFISVQIQPAFKDGWELLTYLVNTMDWTYDMSDDSRAWYSGEAHRKKMEAVAVEMFKVDEKKYYNIVRKALGPKPTTGNGSYLLSETWLTNQ